jgi:hypothetical protein
LLNPVVALNEDTWAKCMGELLAVLGLSKPVKEMVDFLAWENCNGTTATSGAKSAVKAENLFLHRPGGASLPIRFDSIHGVKGETHAATLVVETFAKQHDLEGLLPVLTGTMHGSQLKGSLRGHCKRAFVAMTRPSHLLCLAISSEHIDDAEIAALEANGWRVIKVQAPVDV